MEQKKFHVQRVGGMKMEINCNFCDFKTSDINELADHLQSHMGQAKPEYKYETELYTNSKGKIQIHIKCKGDTIKECVKKAVELYMDAGEEAEKSGLDLVSE